MIDGYQNAENSLVFTNNVYLILVGFLNFYFNKTIVSFRTIHNNLEMIFFKTSIIHFTGVQQSHDKLSSSARAKSSQENIHRYT